MAKRKTRTKTKSPAKPRRRRRRVDTGPFRHRFGELNVARETVDSVRGPLTAWAGVFKPQKKIGTDVWAETEIRIPAEYAATAGKYDLRRYPFWREILAVMDDKTTERIVIMAATQIGKTEVIKAAAVAASQTSPAPAMFAGPDKDYVSEKRDQIYAMADATPAVRDKVPRPHNRNYRMINLGGSVIYLAWSGSPQRLSGKACKRVFCSEIDRWSQTPREGATQKLVAERVKAFALYKIVYESTPTNEDSAIAAFHAGGDQRTWRCPCPHCGHYQELRFFPHKNGPFAGRGGIVGIKKRGGGFKSPDEAIKSAYYICEQGCRIEPHQKNGMVGRGRWVPRGQEVTPAGKLTGTPASESRVRSYHLSSLYAPQITFGRMAAEYLDCRDDPDALRGFWNNWLGLPYHTVTKIPQWRELGRRLAGGHKRGTVPSDAVFLTAGVDKQQDRAYYVVRAWGAGGRSWLVDHGVCGVRIGDDGLLIKNSDLREMARRVIDRRFPTVTEIAGGITSLPVVMTGVDTGYEPAQVWDFIRQFPGERVRAVAGDHKMKSDFYRMNTVERNARTGKVYPGGMKRWGVAVDTYKADIQDRWNLSPSDAAAWLLFHNALELSEDYLRQIVNEGPVWTHNKQGRLVKTWQVINPKTGNHYWDCEVYARAVADMWVGGDWSTVSHEAMIEQMIIAEKQARGDVDRPPAIVTPDGRPYLVTDRN